MEILAGLEALCPVAALRAGRWSYAAVSGLHVLGVALLVGAVAALDLRLLGAWRSVPLAGLARVLRPVAAAGLALAALTGLLLFAVAARDYAGTRLFLVKMALVLAGTAHALARAGRPLADLAPGAARRAGAVSLALWLGALAAGRALGFL